MQVGHGAIGVNQNKPIGKPRDIPPGGFPSEPLGFLSEDVRNGNGLASFLLDDQRCKAVHDALRISRAGFGSNVVDEVVKVAEVLRGSEGSGRCSEGD